jgi:hypothetical protein
MAPPVPIRTAKASSPGKARITQSATVIDGAQCPVRVNVDLGYLRSIRYPARLGPARGFRDRPFHNWASHSADAFRTFAQGFVEPELVRPPQRYRRRPGGGGSWESASADCAVARVARRAGNLSIRLSRRSEWCAIQKKWAIMELRDPCPLSNVSNSSLTSRHFPKVPRKRKSSLCQ